MQAVLRTTASYLGEQLVLQKDRLFLWSPVAFGLGIGLYFSLKIEPPFVLGMGLFAIGLGLAILTFPRHDETMRRFTAWLAAMSFLLVAGGFWAAQIEAVLSHTPMLAKEITYADIEGTVDSIEAVEEGGSRIVLSDLVIEDFQPEQTPRHVQLKLRKDGGLVPGQRIQVLAGLNPAGAPAIPGAFDFQRYSYFSGIPVFGFVYKPPVIVSEAEQNGWDLFWERARLKIIAEINRYMGPREAPMAVALIVGKRQAITEADDEAMRNSGLTHLISISGLHIGLVSALVFFLSRFVMSLIPAFALRHPIKKYAAVLAILAAFFYTVLAGAPVPTQRSMLMTSVIFFAIILDRSPVSMRVLVFAALIVLVLSPSSLLSASFQMSFAAVTGLVAFYEHYSPQISKFYRDSGFFRRAAIYFLGVCMTTLIAGSVTEPFGLYHFQQYSRYGLLANALAVPLSSFMIMPAALFGVILMPLNLSSVPFYVMGKGIEWLYDIAYWVAALPGAVLYTPLWPASALILVVLSGLVLVLWKGHLKFMAALFFLCAGWNVYQIKQPDIVISSDSVLKAYYDEHDTLHVSNLNKDKYILEKWEGMYGQPQGSADKWPREGSLNGMACDGAACRLKLKGKNVSFLSDNYSLSAECEWADILVSDQFIKGDCVAPVVVDKGDVLDEGSHAFFIEEGGQVRVERDLPRRGDRPWVARRKKSD